MPVDAVSRQAEDWAWSVPDLPTAQRLLLQYLAKCHNSGTGRCDPSTATIMAATGLPARSLSRAGRALRASGLIAVVRRGRGPGISNSYALAIPGEHATVAPSGDGEHAKSDGRTRQNRTGEHATVATKQVIEQVKNSAGRPATLTGRPSDARTEAARRVELDDPVGRDEAIRQARDRQAAACGRCDVNSVIWRDDGRVERCDHQPRDGHA